ncbi:MAG: hypothetical protein ABR902_11950 [Candidatus Korobacteraceae bacterium]
MSNFFAVAESDNLQRNRLVDLCPDEKNAKSRTHLLEEISYVTAVLLAGVRNDSEVLGTDLNPFRLSRAQRKGEEQKEARQGKPATRTAHAEAPDMNIVGATES